LANTLSLRFSLNVNDQISYPFKPSYLIYILIFKFLDSKLEDNRFYTLRRLFELYLPPFSPLVPHVEYCLAAIFCFQISYAYISPMYLETHSLYFGRNVLQRVRLDCPAVFCIVIAPSTHSKAAFYDPKYIPSRVISQARNLRSERSKEPMALRQRRGRTVGTGTFLSQSSVAFATFVPLKRRS
jgi:hypothetical protein